MSKINETPPAMRSEFGAAWLLDLEAIRAKEDANPEDCTLMSYIVSAPWAHPVWSNYQISVITLADKPGVRPAVIRKTGATHEIMVLALNPKYVPETDGPPHYLSPINFAGQYIAQDDKEAKNILTKTVKMVVRAELNPDTDFRRSWESLFPE